MPEQEAEVYNVVVNEEGQYSIWRDNLHMKVPKGWRFAGKTGPKSECLSYIKDVWTDMRPLSLQKAMEQSERASPPDDTSKTSVVTSETTSPVHRLMQGDHPVEAIVKPARNIEAFKNSIDRGYAHIKFTDTKGGTQLKLTLEQDRCDLAKANFEARTGTAHLVGKLTLDYTRVLCIAEIDLSTLTGHGHLANPDEFGRGVSTAD